jgi:hypothetical protein
MNAHLKLVAAALAGIPLLTIHAAPREVAATPNGARIELPGKPTGPITVDYRVPAEPVIGAPLEIAIMARLDAGATRVLLDASASDAAALWVASPTLVTQAAGLYTWRVTVVPWRASAGYLNVIVAGEIEGLTQARSVTIPIRSAGPGPVGATVDAGRSPEVLIALPVRETP